MVRMANSSPIMSPNLIRTLIGSKFQLISGTRKPSYILLEMARYDEFGHQAKYLFAYCARKLSEPEILGLKALAKNKNLPLVIVGETEKTCTDVVIIPESKLLGKLGGSIQSFLPLESDFGEQLIALGRNELPADLQGSPNDLFEIYVQQALEFLLQERVIRYGQERRFERLPDGLMASHNFVFLYDCKAAKDGYTFTRDSIRQFSDYIEDFHDRYSNCAPRVHSFLVVSGFFANPSTHLKRSQELYAKCQVPLSFLTSDDLSAMIKMFASKPAYRHSMDWKEIFSSGSISAHDVSKNLECRIRDKVIPNIEEE